MEMHVRVAAQEIEPERSLCSDLCDSLAEANWQIWKRPAVDRYAT